MLHWPIALRARIASSRCSRRRCLESSWCRDEIDDSSAASARRGQVLPRRNVAHRPPSLARGIHDLSAIPSGRSRSSRPHRSARLARARSGGRSPVLARRDRACALHVDAARRGRHDDTLRRSRRRVWIAEPTDHVLDAWDVSPPLSDGRAPSCSPRPGSPSIASEDEYRAAVEDDVGRRRSACSCSDQGPPSSILVLNTVHHPRRSGSSRVRARNPARDVAVAEVALDTIADKAYAELLRRHGRRVRGVSTAGTSSRRHANQSRAAAAAVPAVPIATADEPLSVA